MKAKQATKLLEAINANAKASRKLLMRARRARVDDPPGGECAAPLDDLCDLLHALANLYDHAALLGEAIFCGAECDAECDAEPEAQGEEGADAD